MCFIAGKIPISTRRISLTTAAHDRHRRIHNGEQIQQFFDQMYITELKLPRDDKETSKNHGFAYIEYTKRQQSEAGYNIPDPKKREGGSRPHTDSHFDVAPRGVQPKTKLPPRMLPPVAAAEVSWVQLCRRREQ